MRFVSLEEAAWYIRGRSVAIVGSGPGVLDNRPGFVDSHDVVVRVNNHKCGLAAGRRTDIHYSFYGSSIRKTAHELKREGVRLVMCKCPNSKPLKSSWHERTRRLEGIDFRYIYRNREHWWFCDTYIPDDAAFMAKFELLHRHVPTTGFSAILDVLACAPVSIYLTGFDFFTSGKHNVTDKWRPGDPRDPIGHRPQLENAWVAENASRFVVDRRLAALLAHHRVMTA